MKELEIILNINNSVEIKGLKEYGNELQEVSYWKLSSSNFSTCPKSPKSVKVFCLYIAKPDFKSLQTLFIALNYKVLQERKKWNIKLVCKKYPDLILNTTMLDMDIIDKKCLVIRFVENKKYKTLTKQ